MDQRYAGSFRRVRHLVALSRNSRAPTRSRLLVRRRDPGQQPLVTLVAWAEVIAIDPHLLGVGQVRGQPAAVGRRHVDVVPGDHDLGGRADCRQVQAPGGVRREEVVTQPERPGPQPFAQGCREHLAVDFRDPGSLADRLDPFHHLPVVRAVEPFSRADCPPFLDVLGGQTGEDVEIGSVMRADAEDGGAPPHPIRHRGRSRKRIGPAA